LNGKQKTSDSQLIHLDPFLHEIGLVQMNGRLQNSTLPEMTKLFEITMKIRHCEKEEWIYAREEAQRISTFSTRARSTCSTRVKEYVLVRVDNSSVSRIHCEDNRVLERCCLRSLNKTVST
ncbi:hypothetical protein T08_14204, partial [Trichinella sp. T8]